MARKKPKPSTSAKQILTRQHNLMQGRVLSLRAYAKFMDPDCLHLVDTAIRKQLERNQQCHEKRLAALERGIDYDDIAWTAGVQAKRNQLKAEATEDTDGDED